jgi:pyruvate dehydrogenase E1 component alpha subunit
MKRDPIPALKAAVLEAGIAEEADFEAIEKTVEEEIQAAVKFAVDSPYPEAEEAYEDVLA